MKPLSEAIEPLRSALGLQSGAATSSTESLQATRASTSTLALFSRQLSLMMESGIQLTHALDVLSKQQSQARFGKVVGNISDELIGGRSLSRTLGDYPSVFSRVYVAMVKIGEETGGLSSTLGRLATWQEKDYALYQKTRSALTYPVFVLILSLVIFLLMFRFVLPGFLDSFAGVGEVPLITKVLMLVSDATRSPLFLLFATSLSLFGGYQFKKFAAQKNGAFMLFSLALSLPVVGGFIRSSSVARYAGALCTMLSSGVDLLKATEIAATASGSPVLENDAASMGESICQGQLISEHMKMQSSIYPRALQTMVAAGEESSEVSAMLARAADFYEQDSENRIEVFNVIAEPLLMALVALVVGFIVMGLFLPMYSVLGDLG